MIIAHNEFEICGQKTLLSNNMDILTACERTIADGIVVNFNASGWGPTVGERFNTFDDVPYTHFDKYSKTTRIADFTSIPQTTAVASSSGAGGAEVVVVNPNKAKYEKKRYAKEEVSTEFTFKHNLNEDATFQLVDNTRSTTKRYGAGKTMMNKQQQQQQGNTSSRSTGYLNQQQQHYQQQKVMKDGTTKAAQNTRYQQNNRRPDMKRLERVPAVTVEGDWVVIEEFDLSQLLKLQTAIPEVEDICWCGALQAYDESFDKVTTRQPKSLKKMDKIFYSVTTTDDPVIEKLAVANTGTLIMLILTFKKIFIF